MNNIPTTGDLFATNQVSANKIGGIVVLAIATLQADIVQLI
jgi:hypothetical protein